MPVVTRLVNPKRVAPVAVVLAIGLGAVSTSAAGSSPPDQPTVERWSSSLGWVELPSLPSATPTPVWEATFERPVDRVVSDGEVIVVAEEEDDGFVLTRVDPSTGSAVWEREVSADDGAELEMYVADDGGVVLANVSQPDRGDPGDDVEAWSSDVLVAADGRPAWHLEGGRLYDGHAFGDVVVLEGLDHVYAVDTSTSALRWDLEGLRPLRLDDDAGVVVLVDGYDTIFGVDPQSGDELWTTQRDRWVSNVGETALSIDPSGDGGLTIDFTDITTGQHVNRATVAGMGRFSAVWPGGDDVVVIEGSPDDTSVTVDVDNDSTVTVGLDLRSGEELWRSTGFGAFSALRVDGEVFLIELDRAGASIMNAATGEIVAGSDISSETGDVYPNGPYVYHNVDGELRAASVPDLDVAWRVDLGEDSHLAGMENGHILAYLIPIETGFIAIDRDAADQVVLRGFLGG